MVLPIVTYGSSVLRKKCNHIKEKTPEISELIDNMFDTLEHANGVGLSANQVDCLLNIFIVNYKSGDGVEDESFKEVFINSNITDYSDDLCTGKEGCLSFPSLYEDIKRSNKIKIDYYDKDFVHKVREFDGVIARIIQHEYDHTKGIVFIDKISSLKRKLIGSKITTIIKKKFNVSYKVK